MDIQVFSFDDLFETSGTANAVADLRKLADDIESGKLSHAHVTYVTHNTTDNVSQIVAHTYSPVGDQPTSYSQGYSFECSDTSIYDAIHSNVFLSMDDRQASGNAFDDGDNSLDVWVGSAREDESNLITIEAQGIPK